jgi:hypothetical protein
MSRNLALAYTGAVVLGVVFLVCFLWILAIFAWFRKPIELSASCPLCGSKDFRPSRDLTTIGLIRRKLGVFPFRCRGCTRRFVSRSINGGHTGMANRFAAE